MVVSGNVDNAKSGEGASGDELTEERFLEEYKKKEYPKPSLTADIAVFRRGAKGLEVLMIRRGKHPYQGCWALPGGFANPNEDVMDAAQRELEEETGVTGISVELFGIYGEPGRDPRGWTVSGGFCALVDAGISIEAGDDAADARWCTVEELDVEQPLGSCDGDAAEGADDTRELVVRCADDTRELVVRCADDTRELVVRCADELLRVRFAVVRQNFGAPRTRVVDSSGFAFDHAHLLADAYLKVTQGVTGDGVTGDGGLSHDGVTGDGGLSHLRCDKPPSPVTPSCDKPPSPVTPSPVASSCTSGRASRS